MRRRRSNLRAIRKPWLLWLALIALLSIATGTGCSRDRDPSPPIPSPGASDGLTAGLARRSPSPPVWTTRVDTIRAGDTFGALLLRNKIHVEEVAEIVAYIRSAERFSLRRLRPGEAVRLRTDGMGRFLALQYERGPDEVHVVERDGEGFAGYVDAVDYDLRLRKLSGHIETTVEEALESRHRAVWTVEMATILAFEVDFLTEPRSGDAICLLVEEKWLGPELLGLGRIRYLSYEGELAAVTAAYHVPADSAGAGYFTPAGESVRRAFLRSPLNYRRISSGFSRNRFHPILRVWRPHLGVDYAAPSGTPVVAVGSGVVILARTNGGFGRQVKLRHGSAYETWYGHLSRLGRGIRQGVRVKRGDVIGYVGATGLATGPHLDFRVKERGEFIDPLKMRNPREEPLAGEELGAFGSALARLRALADSLPPGGLVAAPGGRAAVPGSAPS